MLIVNMIKYVFVAGLAVEIALILRALFALARDKARGTGEAPAALGE